MGSVSEHTPGHQQPTSASPSRRDLLAVEESLRRSEQRYRSLVQVTSQVIWTTTSDGRVVEDLPTWRAFTGQSAEQIMGFGWMEALHPDDRARTATVWANSLRNKTAHENEFRVRAADGSWRHVLARAVPVLEEDGSVREWVGTCTDITERKRAEEAARASEARYRKLVEQSPLSTQTFYPDGRVRSANAAWERLFGVKMNEIGAYNILQDQQLVEHGIMPLIQRGFAGEPTSIPPIPYVPDRGIYRGAERWCGAFIYPVRNELGQIEEVVLIHEDITERKRAEQELGNRTRSVKLLSNSATRLLMNERPEELLDVLFKELGAHLGLEVYFNHLVSDDGQTLYLNACGGVSQEQTDAVARLHLGEGVCGKVAAEQERVVLENVQQSTGPLGAIVRAQGVTAYACHPLIAHGRLIGTLSFGTRSRNKFDPREIDLMRALSDQIAMALERQRLTAELHRRAEELTEANRAKDQFLAVLSHELRTPLTPVLATVSALEMADDVPPGVRADLEVIRRNVELEARLIDDLLDLTRITKGKLHLNQETIDVHDCLEKVLHICQSDIREKALHVTTHYSAQPCCVFADSARLQQVFWNLVKNAVKFTPPDGSITLRTTSTSSDGTLCVEVIDTGVGIDPQLLPHIFDAFHQGPESSRALGGLGLGLTITKALVELHGGKLLAQSSGRGAGATFRVTLPLVPATERAPAPPRSISPIRSCRILLVEDHADTARIMLRLLRASGYEVQWAGTVEAAVKLADEQKFDVLVSDLGLPDGSGLDLMRQLRARYNLPGIALSGFGMEEDIRKTREAGFQAHLIKPVHFQALRDAIDQIAPQHRQISATDQALF